METTIGLRFFEGRVRTVVLIICLYIIQEQSLLYLQPQPFNPAWAIAYYILDVSFFFLASYWSVPLTLRRSGPLVKGLIALLCTFTLYIAAQNILDLILRMLQHPAASFAGLSLSCRLSLFRGFYLLIPATAYFVSREGMRKMERSKDLEIEKAELKTAFLRSRIKPHLIFNSLSFVYTLIKTISPQAAKVVRLQTKVLRYAFAERVTPVTLGEELDQMFNYIELNRERLGEQLCLDVSITVDERVKILPFPPLVLIGFVENMFMHGNLSKQNHPGILVISSSGQKPENDHAKS